MRLTVRPRLFETNSSSTHSVTLMPGGSREAFLGGKVFVSPSVKREIVEDLGVRYGDLIDYEDIVDKFHNDFGFKKKFSDWWRAESDGSEASNVIYWNGFFFLDRLKRYGYTFGVFDTVTPGGDDVTAVSYYCYDA